MQLPTSLHSAEFQTVKWHHTAAAGQTTETIQKPSYWQHVATQLRPGHEITVTAEDRTWWAHLLVRDVGKGEALVGVIHEATFGAVEAKDVESDCYVKYVSPSVRFCVFRKSDDERLETGFETKEAAHAWAVQRDKAMAA